MPLLSLPLPMLLSLFCGAAAIDVTSDGAAAAKPASFWRIVNTDEVEIAWRVRSLQLFSDDGCTKPIMAQANETGVAFGTKAADMTAADYVFMLGSPRGWETEDICAVGESHLGFEFHKGPVDVRCIVIHQGDDGFYAYSMALQSAASGSGPWSDVGSWSHLPSGKTKISLACPSVPSVPHAEVGACTHVDARSKECGFRCLDGFGTPGGEMVRCVHGAWYSPQCLPVGTMVRLVATAPERIKPYWVVLHAGLYASEDCTDEIRMEGSAISSGEFVIKYASYHARNAWDGSSDTSWASNERCSPSKCWLGFHFQERPRPVRCVRVEHPHGSEYHASAVKVEWLGQSGWEEDQRVLVQLLPLPREEL